MKTVGIVGGIGPGSTVEYYRSVIGAYRERLLSIADRMKEREGIEGLILGGTELPLILRDETYGGIPLLDTTRIHVNAAVAQLLS